jgi:hypothetical protein
MSWKLNTAFRIPIEPGQAVSRGWTPATDNRPAGITWHWAVTRSLVDTRTVLGGAHALRRGRASAHYCIGKSFAEGIDEYVSLEDRSWHAGKNQTLRWDGAPSTAETQGSRSTIGIETVHMGFAAAGAPYTAAATPGGVTLRIEHWTEEQIQMAIELGRQILDRWPHIGPRDHHGHHDLCPVDPAGNTYKIDVIGFPFARVLRGLYPDREIPDVWTPCWSVLGREKALAALNYTIAADGRWTPRSTAVLKEFQRDIGMVENGLWTTFTCWAVYDVLRERGDDLAEVTR